MRSEDAAAGDRFGHSVALDGGIAVVGARYEDDAGEDAGAAYVFARDAGGPDQWGEVAKLTGGDTAAGDDFGYDVAVSGDLVAVGARGDDDAGPGSGAVYVFARDDGGPDGWGEVVKIVPADVASNDGFGTAVALHGDLLVASAPLDDDAGTNAGAVYVFARNEGGPDQWGQIAELTPDASATAAFFGGEVLVNGDVVVVGAPLAEAVHLFGRNEGGQDHWGQVARIEADAIGHALDLHGDLLAVGSAASCILFARNQGGPDRWGEVARLTATGATASDFGRAVALGGPIALVGAPLDDEQAPDAGAIYAFGALTAYVREEGVLTASDAEPQDVFGLAVAVSGDVAVVGSPGADDACPADPNCNSGAAYVLARDADAPQGWTEVRRLTESDAESSDHFGWSVSVSGDTAVLGAPGADDACPGGGSLCESGAAYVFARDEGGPDNWGQVRKLVAPDAAQYDFYGISVTVSGDVALVGASGDDEACASDPGCNAGSVYVHERNHGGPDAWGYVTKLTTNDAEAGDVFGAAVAIDGDVAAIGAPGQGGYEIGVAYVFERTGSGPNGWVQVRKLAPIDGCPNDRFGRAIAVSGDTIVVGTDGGCAGFDHGWTHSGAAYVFERDQGGPQSWGQVAKLTAFDAEYDDQYGLSVSIDGDVIVIGALEDDDHGSIYVYRRDPGGTGCWDPAARLESRSPGYHDQFGTVSIDGMTILVGAQQADDACPAGSCDAGAVHVFALADCNGNGELDHCDLAGGVSLDINANGIPDECECLADLDQSGDVAFADLIALLALWGTAPDAPPDLDLDADVGFSDLLILLAAWGPCP